MTQEKELLDLLLSLDLHVSPLAYEDRGVVFKAYSEWIGVPIMDLRPSVDDVFVMQGGDVVYAGPPLPALIYAAAYRVRDRKEAPDA